MRTQVDTASFQASGQPDETSTGERLVQLLEEMIDLKIQQLAQASMKYPPEIAQLMQQKQQTDRRRLDQIRIELIRLLQA